MRAASNDTPEGKAQNRRIQISLVPDLAQLEGIKEAVEGSGSQRDLPTS